MNALGPSLRFALTAVADITATITLPAIVGAVVGKALDARYGTGHILFGVIMTLAFLATAIVLLKKIRQYADAYKKQISH